MNNSALLKQYLPASSVDEVYDWIVAKKIHFTITKNRKTKLGDYRPPIRHTNHRITINHNLNRYSFLITFVHELAHLLVFEQFKTRVAPHGNEWKSTYQTLLNSFLEKDIFPDDIKQALKNTMKKTRASSTSELQLSRVLMLYDKSNNHAYLEQLDHEALFQTENGRVYQKGEQRRTRFKCLNLQNKRYYLFHPLTPVFSIQD